MNLLWGCGECGLCIWIFRSSADENHGSGVNESRSRSSENKDYGSGVYESVSRSSEDEVIVEDMNLILNLDFMNLFKE